MSNTIISSAILRFFSWLINIVIFLIQILSGITIINDDYLLCCLNDLSLVNISINKVKFFY